MTIAVESEGDGPPVTTLTGNVDQAAWQGLLRRLYFQGLPLISVVWVECGRHATCITADDKMKHLDKREVVGRNRVRRGGRPPDLDGPTPAGRVGTWPPTISAAKRATGPR